MTIGSRVTFLALSALMTGACVGDIEGTDEELDADDIVDIEEGEIDGTDVDAEQLVPELFEPERIDEQVDSSQIAASGLHSWSITVVRGVAGLGATFGDGNAPDLYVKRICGGLYRNRTLVKYNTTSPYWNSTLMAASQTDDYVKSCSLELWDDDSNGDDFGGRIYLRSYADEMIRNGWSSITRSVRLTANDPVIVYFKLTRR
jgi:hypothetical protein